MTLINHFFAPANEVADIGLEEISMTRLGRFVALAGRNGAGKSRVLSKLEWYVSARINCIDQVPHLRQQVKDLESAIASNPGNANFDSWVGHLNSAKNQLLLAHARVISINDQDRFKSIRFVPKGLTLADPRHHTRSQTTTGFAQARVPGVANLEQHSPFYIRQLQERWWNASHQHFSGSPEEKQSAIDAYTTFCSTLRQLLRIELDRNVDGEPTLFGKPIADANLSDGQKVILQLCVALHAQKSDFEGTVFILDEPENHLHPSAVIDLLEALYRSTDRSQIWIATHSVPLLAYVANIEPMALWYVENGAVKNSGRAPQNVLAGLLGSEERISELNTFTGLPAQLASIQYACESLMPPQVVSGGERDPQVNQVQRVLLGLADANPRCILDYGAGKGRLLNGLADGFKDIGKDLQQAISYYAFDPYPDESKDICKATIQANFPDGITRHFSSPDEFFGTKNDGSIDVVVMCNVLHEIPPTDWTKTFSNTSLIGRSLAEDGYILIVEDQRIPVGEKAHQHGFLVLDTSHIRTLFAIKEDDSAAGLFHVDDARNDGRLKAHLISKKLVMRITSDTRKQAINQLRETAKEQIRRLRQLPANYLNGQMHGFWTQQFANASLYLEEA